MYGDWDIDIWPIFVLLFLIFGMPLLIPLVIGISRGTSGRFWRNTLAGLGIGILTVSALVGWFALVTNSPAAFTLAFFPAFLGGVFMILIGTFLITRWALRRLDPRD